MIFSLFKSKTQELPERCKFCGCPLIDALAYTEKQYDYQANLIKREVHKVKACYHLKTRTNLDIAYIRDYRQSYGGEGENYGLHTAYTLNEFEIEARAPKCN